MSRLLTGDFQRSRPWRVGPRRQQPPCPHKEGRGVATVRSTPTLFQGQAWPQYTVPAEISARRDTVAMPALTSDPMGGVLCPRWPAGMTQGQRVPPVGGRTEDGESATSRPSWESGPGVGRPLPQAPRAINQTRQGVATVITHQPAELLPRPHDRAHVIRSTTTVIYDRKDPPAADAAYRLHTEPVGGAHQSAGPRSRRTAARETDGWARV